MNIANRTTLLIAYFEAIPLMGLMLLVMRFVLHVEEVDVSKGIIFPLTLPLFVLAFNWLVNEKHWGAAWLVSVEHTVSTIGALSIFYNDFLRYIVLAVLFSLFFRVLNKDVLRLPERTSKGSP